MRPDVTLISPYPRLGARHDGNSGVASYTANLANALAGLGATICVVAPELEGEPSAGYDGPVEVRRAFRQGDPRAVPAALSAARETGAPVTHLQHELFLYSGVAGLPATVAALSARRYRSRKGSPARTGSERTVITMHQVVDPGAVTRTYTQMHRIGVPAGAARAAIATVQRVLPTLADAVLVHEPAFRRIIPSAIVVPHGIEVPAPSHEPRAHIRHRLGVAGDRLLALCFGFLAPYKGLETALEAAVLAGEAVHVVVAGGPHPRLAAQGDRYDQRLRDRWGGTATFTGYVPDAAIADWFRAADVALFCYPEPHASSGPLALALAHRTPALLSKRLAETVGADTELAVSADPRQWASRLRGLADDSAQLGQLSDQVNRMSEDRSWTSIASRHIALYQEVTHHDSVAGTEFALA